MGNPEALRVIAIAHFNGQGVPRDYGMAGQYMQQMADLGDGNSMKFLADMYEKGYLGPPNPAKASELRLEAQRLDSDSEAPAALAPFRRAPPPASPTVHRRRYVTYRPYGTSYSYGQPMVGGIFRAPAAGATCCPPGSLICPGALPRC